jgi:CRISPR/Cas system-associated endonuclease/helicase Cas3
MSFEERLKSIQKQLEKDFIDFYSIYKLAQFYENSQRVYIEESNVKRVKSNLQMFFEQNNSLLEVPKEKENNEFGFPSKNYNAAIGKRLNQLKLEGIKQAQKYITQGKRNKYVKEMYEEQVV